MPCCGQPVITMTTTLQTIPGAIIVEVNGLSKQDLNSIFPFYNTINHNPVQLGDKNYDAGSLRFVTLLDAKLSNGKFSSKAIFQPRGSNPQAGLSRVDWLPLFLMLWKPQIEAAVAEPEAVAETESQPLQQEPYAWQRPIPSARP